MKQEINLDRILKSYLTVEAMQANKPDYTYNMVITAMKHACCEVLDLAAENATVKPIKIPYTGVRAGGFYTVDEVGKDSILEIKDWIK